MSYIIECTSIWYEKGEGGIRGGTGGKDTDMLGIADLPCVCGGG